MKKIAFTSLFVFSLTLNLAVIATLGWHLWDHYRTKATEAVGESALTSDDIKRISNICSHRDRESMMEARRRIMGKQVEVLDLIAKNPGNPKIAEQRLQELQALKAATEKEALTRISKALAALPEQRRAAFMVFLKDRTCMGPGMGMGRRGCCAGPCPMKRPRGN